MVRHRISDFILLLTLLVLSASSVPAWGAGWEALPLWGGEVKLAASADLSVVYAAAPNGGLYQSTNGGLTWHFIANGPPGHFDLFLKVDPFVPRRLYIKGFDPLTFFYHLYRSEDGGRRWQRADAGFATDSVADFALDPSTPGLVYAATSAGVFRSRNRGISWSRISDLRPHRIAVTPHRSGRPARDGDPERSGMDAAEHQWRAELRRGLRPAHAGLRLRSHTAATGVRIRQPGGLSERRSRRHLGRAAVPLGAPGPRSADVLYAGTDGSGLFRLAMEE